MFRYADPQTWASLRSFRDDMDGPPVGIRPVEVNGDLSVIADTATAIARYCAGREFPVVFCPPIATFSGPAKASEEALANGLALSVELDTAPARARQKLEFLLGPATVVVASGGAWADPATGEVQPKLHLHWRLKEPTRAPEEHAKLKRARTIATAVVGADASNTPIVHPLRWPGSVHRKAEPKLCQIIEINHEAEIDLGEALAALQDVQPEPHASAAGAGNGQGHQAEDTAELIKKILTGEGFHQPLTALAWRKVAGGMNPGQVVLDLQGSMLASLWPRDTRWQSRFGDIPRIVATAQQKLAAQGGTIPQPPAAAAEEPWPEPDMSVLAAQQLPAPALPLEVFGPYWSNWLAAQAEAKSCAPDYVAAGLLAAAGALIGSARWGSPWAGWMEPPVLWCAGIGNPSSGKSPGLDGPRDLLSAIEAEANSGRKADLHEWDTARRAAKLHLELWEGAVKVAIRDDRPAPPRPSAAEEPERPAMTRVVTDNPTIERLAALIAENPKGMLLFRDELAGFIGSLDRYGGDGSDRAFYLQAYGGRPFTVDRVKHPEPIVIPALTVAICGGIQPDRLRSQVLSGDDDGLAARFLYFWPEPVPPRRPTRLPPSGAMTKLQLLHGLKEQLGQDGRRVPLRFSPAAAEAVQDFRLEVATVEAEAAGLFQSWLGKLSGSAVRLATILEHLSWVGDREQGMPPQEISERAAIAAIAFLDSYALPMARRCFGDAGQPQADRDAVAIARWIVAQSPVPKEINLNNLRRHHAPIGRESERYHAAFAELAAAGWVRLLIPPLGAPGRKPVNWAVNPKLSKASDRS